MSAESEKVNKEGEAVLNSCATERKTTGTKVNCPITGTSSLLLKRVNELN